DRALRSVRLGAPPIAHYAPRFWARRRSRINARAFGRAADLALTPALLGAPPISHYARPLVRAPIAHYAPPPRRAADLAFRPSAWARRRSRITPPPLNRCFSRPAAARPPFLSSA